MISLIAALDENGVIGQKGSLPWPPIKADFARFRYLTLGKPVVMGRKTFFSLKQPLAGRKNIVLTRHLTEIPGGVVVHSIEEVLKLTRGFPEIMIIGGASIYQQFLPLAEKMYLTYHLDFARQVRENRLLFRADRIFYFESDPRLRRVRYLVIHCLHILRFHVSIMQLRYHNSRTGKISIQSHNCIKYTRLCRKTGGSPTG